MIVIAGAAAGGLIAARSASAAPAFRVWRRKVLGSIAGLDRKHVLQQISAHPVRHQSGQVCPEPVQFRCRATMRRPIDACLDAAAHRTAKPRQPQCHLSEQRRDRVVTIIFHPANPLAAGTGRPPDRVPPCLRGGDLALNPREQLRRFRESQSQIGDIAEVIRFANLHDVHAGPLAPGHRQLQDPLHAPPPAQEQERKYPARTDTPSCAPVPLAGRFREFASGVAQATARGSAPRQSGDYRRGGGGSDAGLSRGGGDHGRSAGRLAGVAAAPRLIAGRSSPKPLLGFLMSYLGPFQYRGATCHPAGDDSGADDQQCLRRISGTSVAPSRRRRRCPAQPTATQHPVG